MAFGEAGKSHLKKRYHLSKGGGFWRRGGWRESRGNLLWDATCSNVEWRNEWRNVSRPTEGHRDVDSRRGSGGSWSYRSLLGWFSLLHSPRTLSTARFEDPWEQVLGLTRLRTADSPCPGSGMGWPAAPRWPLQVAFSLCVRGLCPLLSGWWEGVGLRRCYGVYKQNSPILVSFCDTADSISWKSSQRGLAGLAEVTGKRTLLCQCRLGERREEKTPGLLRSTRTKGYKQSLDTGCSLATDQETHSSPH